MPCVHVHLATSFSSRGSPPDSLLHSLPSVCIPVGTFVDFTEFLFKQQQQGGRGGKLQRAAVHSTGLSSRNLNVCWLRETPTISLWRDSTRASRGLWRPSGVHMASCESDGRFSALLPGSAAHPSSALARRLFFPLRRSLAQLQSHPVSSTQVWHLSMAEMGFASLSPFFLLQSQRLTSF